MAKLLAYKRNTREVVTVDTINPTITPVGNAIAGADNTNVFPNRSENLVCTFRGDHYLLYRTATNEVHLSKYDFGTDLWSDVVGFSPIVAGGGFLTPNCLQVVQDRLVAIATLSLDSPNDGVIARRSDQDDGGTWDPTVTTLFTTQPLDNRAGPSVVWHNAVWFTTAEGIGHYDPATDTLSATFDTGDDTFIVDQKVNFGSFTFFENDLYYILPTDNPVGAPLFYRLDKTWSTTVPTPTFINVLIVIPGVGAVILSNDTGNYSIFVSKVGVISLLYSGSVESKLVQITKSGNSFDVTDVSEALLPTNLRSEPNLGFAFYADDRRSTNEQHTVLVRFRPTIPVSVILLSWDGVNPLVQVGSLDDGGSGLDLMVPDEERSDFRTFTDNQPSSYIDDTNQPFPGRVVIDYTVQDKNSRPVDVISEFSVDGQTWSEMTQGDGDSGKTGLTTSPTGLSYLFNWDAFADLDGDFDNVDIRIIARIAGV